MSAYSMDYKKLLIVPKGHFGDPKAGVTYYDNEARNPGSRPFG